jgi:hypothetical protein
VLTQKSYVKKRLCHRLSPHRVYFVHVYDLPVPNEGYQYAQGHRDLRSGDGYCKYGEDLAGKVL